MHEPDNASNRRWLLAIDLQHAFLDPSSPWGAPAPAGYFERLEKLTGKYAGRTLFTKFVPPDSVDGSWSHYYDKWKFALDADAAWLWDVPAPWNAFPSLSRHTFSKASPALEQHVAGTRALCIVGISTECCVLATALAAVDLGYHVRLVSDLCLSKDPSTHEQAIRIMSLRSPQLEVLSFSEEMLRAD